MSAKHFEECGNLLMIAMIKGIYSAAKQRVAEDERQHNVNEGISWRSMISQPLASACDNSVKIQTDCFWCYRTNAPQRNADDDLSRTLPHHSWCCPLLSAASANRDDNEAKMGCACETHAKALRGAVEFITIRPTRQDYLELNCGGKQWQLLVRHCCVREQFIHFASSWQFGWLIDWQMTAGCCWLPVGF